MTSKKNKALGQHFIRKSFILRKIIHCISPQPEDLIIEIGAGKGALTFPLAQKAGNVIAVEKDKTLIPYLENNSFTNLRIINKDVLNIDFNELLHKEKKEVNQVKIVGNLPYSISSPILFKLLASKDRFSESIFLLQKEVAERIASQPGSKKYSALSIFFQLFFIIKIHFKLSPKWFSPPPKVESVLISFKKREKPLFPIVNEDKFHNFLKISFQHRRKTLFNNLKTMNFSSSLINKAYTEIGIKFNCRAEQLTISQFFQLYKFLTFMK
ncbi:MAG: 16S rRNA (adenine(1518)-N(6)/adenine(1519)-N(6))-dimethyltransferase RsmA [Candidatus Aminicenantaceae bacterium]